MAPTTTVATTVKDAYVVTSVDPRGASRFLFATAHEPLPFISPADAARMQVHRVATAFALTNDALATLRPSRTVTSRMGTTITTLRQEIDGIEVYGSDTKVMLRGDRSLVAIAGAPHPAAVAGTRQPFKRSAQQAVVAALRSAVGVDATVRDRGDLPDGWRGFDLDPGPYVASDPIRVRAVYFADGTNLVPAYRVELIVAKRDSTSSRGYERLIAADDGRVLAQIDLTSHAAFNYRVWADATSKRVFDGPNADYTPHPTGLADFSSPGPASPILVSMESFNMPPGGGVDPWLAANATATQGNNADAYSDRIAPDGFTSGQDFWATTTAANTFDRTYDVNLSPIANQAQSMAAITSAFYTVNWMHDYWYNAGFDEAAGNAQANNFGRGGVGGDAIRVEVQDNADTALDNANMSTPADGVSPRMQLYLWSPAETRYVRLTPGTGDLPAGGAPSFGPQTFDVTDTVAMATPAEGCTAITGVSGQIALIDRGTCTFIDKVRAAQTAGATGVIIADNVLSATPPQMGGSGGQPITIPVVSITKSAGDSLKTQLMTMTVSARLFRQGGPLRDGALDATVVMHEWGHYLHHRLSSAGGTQQGGALSEGWGDFVALQHMLRAGDSLTGSYAVAGYAGALDPNSSYWGIRRTPYSSDLTKNPLTFRHIGDSQTLPPGVAYNIFTAQNSEIHNAGEIWAQMLFEAYLGLQAAPGARTFDQARDDMAAYAVAGLALTPPDATFTEARDAILAAVAAGDTPTDVIPIALGFAKRGAGTCAVSPPRASTTLDGVIESFELKPKAAIGNVTIEEVASCDRDGILDAQERGRVKVVVSNAGPAALTDGQLTISSPTAGVSFPAGATVAVPSLGPLASTTVEVDIELAASFTGQILVLDVSVASAQMCTPSVATSVSREVNRDETANASATDSVEASVTTWTSTGANAGSVWSRLAMSPTVHVWRGTALGLVSDTQLVSPDLVVGSGAFSMTFQHRHDFEATTGPTTYWDGGVIEVSTNGGTTWVDVSTLGAAPGYGGTITTTSNNPIGGRQAYVRRNAAYPNNNNIALNFGTALSGQTIKVRFRIGTDEAVGAEGWTIDNIAFTGLTNLPFHSVGADTTVCQAPIANAGPDQTVLAGATVTLDGSLSSDPNPSDTLTYAWTQTAGPTVVLLSATTAMPTFTAPASSASLTFQLAVTDGWATSTDSVTITVSSPPDAAIDAPPDAPPDAPADAMVDAMVDAPPTPPDAQVDAALPIDAAVVVDAPPGTPDAYVPDASTPTGGGDDGCSCAAGRTSAPTSQLPLLLATAFLLGRRRRRR